MCRTAGKHGCQPVQLKVNWVLGRSGYIRMCGTAAPEENTAVHLFNVYRQRTGYCKSTCSTESELGTRESTCSTESELGTRESTCSTESELGTRESTCSTESELGTRESTCSTESELGTRESTCSTESELGTPEHQGTPGCGTLEVPTPWEVRGPVSTFQ